MIWYYMLNITKVNEGKRGNSYEESEGILFNYSFDTYYSSHCYDRSFYVYKWAAETEYQNEYSE